VFSITGASTIDNHQAHYQEYGTQSLNSMSTAENAANDDNVSNLSREVMMKKIAIRYGPLVLGCFLTMAFMGHALCGGSRAVVINLLLILFAGSFLFTLADPSSARAVVISISAPITVLMALFVLGDPGTGLALRLLIAAITIAVSSLGAAAGYWLGK